MSVPETFNRSVVVFETIRHLTSLVFEARDVRAGKK